MTIIDGEGRIKKLKLVSALANSANANIPAVPGLNCAHQNLPYIQVLTVQRERQKVLESGRFHRYGLSMLWHPKDELDAEGRPDQKEMIWALLAFPLLLIQLSVWISRVWKSFHGHPLESFLFEARMNGPLWPFVGVLAIYLVAIVIATALLWACCLQAQRWLYWRNR